MDEIPLADSQEIPLDEIELAESPKSESGRHVPVQPLPRLWKTEPEPDEETDDEDKGSGPGKKGGKVKDAAAPSPRSKARAPEPRPAKPKKKKVEDEPRRDKKVLIEETPTFDTIESRQRARMIMGGLMVFCLFIMGWVVYGMIFGGSSNLDLNSAEVPAAVLTPPAAPTASREPEAQYMLDRARDYAKRDQVKAAMAMLDRVVSVYKGTKAAAEARAALERPRQGLPLFPDRPFLLAQKAAEPPPAAKAAPPPAQAAGPGAGTPGIPPNPTPAAPPPLIAMSGPVPGPPPAPQSALSPRAGASANPGTYGPATSPAPAPNPGGGATIVAPPAAAPTPSVTGPPLAPPGPPPGMSLGNTSPPPAIANGGPRSDAPPPAVANGGPRSVPLPPAPGHGAGAMPAQPGAQPLPPAPGQATIVPPFNPAGPDLASVNPDRSRTPAGRVGRMLPPGFQARPEAGLHDSGWPMVIVGERDGGNMVLIPGGTFTMGSDRDARSGPAHLVQLSSYYIDQHEVTNRQFRKFLADTRYHGQPPGKWLTDPKLATAPDDAPALFVSYQDAEEYTLWALKRLPTEAQWEFAARSADNRRYPWGDQPVRWSRPRKLQQIDAVMSFPEDVSPFGVFDLAGNAEEWVRDWYDPAYYSRLRDRTTLDPTGPPTKRQGIHRTVKGGAKDWLMYARNGMDSDRRSPYVGFRCSLAVEGAEASALINPHPVKPETPAPGAPPGQGGGNAIPF